MVKGQEPAVLLTLMALWKRLVAASMDSVCSKRLVWHKAQWRSWATKIQKLEANLRDTLSFVPHTFVLFLCFLATIRVQDKMSASAFDYNLKIENKKVCDILTLRPLFSGQGKNRPGYILVVQLVLIIPKPGESHTAKITSENFFWSPIILLGIIILFLNLEGEEVIDSFSPQEMLCLFFLVHGNVGVILFTNIGCRFVKRYLTSKETT